MKRPSEKEIEEKIRQFAKKKCGTIGMHNMYYIFSEDKDGNVTGEAYAINSYTDAGLRYVFVDQMGWIMNEYYSGTYNSTSAGWLHFGTEWPEVTQENPNAGTPLDPNFGSMYNEVFDVYFGSFKGYNHFFNYIYNSTPLDLTVNGTFLIGTVPYSYCSTDYNYSNLTENVQIKELGIESYNSGNAITLHARVTDENGDPSFIWKRINEKLTVYIYGSHSVPISLMKNKYDAGWNGNAWNVFDAEFLFVNPQLLWYTKGASVRLKANVNDKTSEYYYSLSGNGSSDGAVTTVTDESDTNHQVLHNCKLPSVLFEGQHDFVDSIYTRHSIGSDRTSINNIKFIRQSASNTDVLETNMLTCNNGPDSWWNDDYRITNMFGLGYNSTAWRGLLPTTYFTLQEIKMFNIQTNAFDINEQFSSCDDLLYHFTWAYSGYVRMKWPDDNSYDTAVFMNPNPQYAITKFNNTITEMWCSDAWWDVSTWQNIPDYSNISTALGKKRYYIIKWSNGVTLNPEYGTSEPRLIPMTQYKELGVNLQGNSDWWQQNYQHCIRILGNDVDHFVVGLNQIVCLDSNKDHVSTTTINGYGGGTPSRNHKYYYGSKICILNLSYEEGDSTYSGKGARIYDVSDPTDVTYTDVVVDTNTNVTNSTYIHHMGHLMNDKPYVVFWDKIQNQNSKYCFQVLDFSQSNTAEMVTEFEDAINPAVIAHSNFVMYRDATDMEHLIFHIYDLANGQTVHTFQLNDAYFGDLVGCHAYSTNGTLNGCLIYITIQNPTTQANVTYHYSPSTQITTVTTCPNVTSTWTNPALQWFGCEHCGLLYVMNSSRSDGYFYIYNPSNPMTAIQYSGMQQQVCILKYINQSKQLILGGLSHALSGTVQWNRARVIDIGHLLYNGENMITADDWFPYEDQFEKDDIAIPYDKGCIMYKKGSNANKELIYVPIEKCIPHYAKLSTRTIQAYNNPIQIGGIELNDCFTNVVNRTSPVV
jgi:hypothetical protein